MQKLLFTALVTLFIGFTAYSQNTFTLESDNLGGNATKVEEFNGFGCTGTNVSPQLSWENAPEGTKSFAITMYDPDAPTGSGWWHWVVFDIPADISEVAKNAGNLSSGLMPKGAIQSITNYGAAGYGGPCPPPGHGIHQYIITIHALKVDKLGLNAETNPATVGYYIWSNTLAKASIVTYYQRN
jgi:Raf kinase inhibitor-like YbhB/YbcL family protein